MKTFHRSVVATSAGVVAIVGLVLVPAAVNAGDTTTINANVQKTVSLSTSGSPVNLAITATGAGSFTSGSDTVTVSTNSPAGYTLSIKAATTTLGNGTDTLAASSATAASPSTLLKNTWGYRIDDATATTGFTNSPATTAETNVASLTSTKWAGVTASDVTLKSTSGVATNDNTVVWFGTGVDTSKSGGTYTGSVTFTAAAK